MIYVDDYQIGTGSSFVGTGKAYEVRRRERAVTTTLDAYIQATGLVPDLLKIDVEGAEELALEGARELLAARRATFLIEVLPETIDGVLTHLDGYRILLIDDHNNATVPFERGRVDHYVNILAVPAGSRHRRRVVASPCPRRARSVSPARAAAPEAPRARAKPMSAS